MELLGREKELAAAGAAIAAVGEGAPRSLAVMGEAGIGKSALLLAVQERAGGAGLLVLSGRAAEHERDVPFGLVVDALDDHVAAMHHRRVETVGPELAAVLPSAAAMVDGDAPAAAPGLSGLAPFPMTVEEAYRDVLFHGPLFQRIQSIEGMDSRGATALLLPSDPRSCINGAEGAWLLDPVLVDCALQMQVIWARLNWDSTLLPAMIGGFVSSATPAPDEPVRHELRIRPESVAPLCHCDHYFYGADGRLLAAMTNVQGIGSKALNRLAGVAGQ